jgi:hypothetical protein
LHGLLTLGNAVKRRVGLIAQVHQRLMSRGRNITLRAMHRRKAEAVSLAQQQIAKLGLTDAHSIFEHGDENGLQVTR